jgi:tetratricopeptide (TPR) repeat protein
MTLFFTRPKRIGSLLVFLSLLWASACSEKSTPDPAPPPDGPGKSTSKAEEQTRLLQEARDRLAVGEARSAYGILEQASLRHGDDPTYLGLIGSASWQLGNFGEARKHWEAALSAVPLHLDATLGVLLDDLSHRRLDKVQERLAAAEKGFGPKAQPRLKSFRCFLENLRLDPMAAEAAANEALQADPNEAGAHRCLALLKMQAHLVDAEEHLDKASQIQPKHPQGLALSGLLATYVGDLEKSASLFEASVKSGDKDPWVWSWAIRSMMQAGDLEGSEKRLLRAKEALGVSFPDLTRLEAELALSTDSRKAQHLMRNLTEDHPEDPAIKLLLARSHQARGDVGRAVDAYAESVKLAPYFLEGYFFAGEGMMRLGKLERSQAYFEQLLERDPNRIDALLLLSEIHALRRDAPATLTAFQRAAKLTHDPTTLACQKGSTLAKYFPKKKRHFRELEGSLKSCIANNPEHATARKSLAVHYDNQKSTRQAIPVYIEHMKRIDTDPDNHFIRDRLIALKVSKKKIPKVRAGLPDIEDVETKRKWRRRVGSKKWNKTVSSYRSSASRRPSSAKASSEGVSSNSCYSQYLSCTKSCAYYSKNKTAVGYRLFQSCRQRCGTTQSMCYRRSN